MTRNSASSRSCWCQMNSSLQLYDLDVPLVALPDDAWAPTFRKTAEALCNIRLSIALPLTLESTGELSGRVTRPHTGYFCHARPFNP